MKKFVQIVVKLLYYGS